MGVSRGHWIALATTVAVIATFVGAIFFVMNFTIVHDPHRVVVDARQVWTGGSKPMTRLPWGAFIIYVEGEGGIEVTCRDGTVTDGGYVTGFMADDYSVSTDCEIEP